MTEMERGGVPVPGEIAELTLEVQEMDPQLARLCGEMVRSMMEPMMELMRRTVQAIDDVSAAQAAQTAAMQVQNDRIAAMEKQIRLQTPITPAQARMLGEAIKKRAAEVMAEYGIGGGGSRKLATAIRKDVLRHYGLGAMAELPRHEYPVALSQIERWLDGMTVMEISVAFPREVGSDGEN